MKWSDVTRRSDGATLSAQKVTHFPKLDGERQSFVQMEPTAGILIVGIHDKEDGNFQSGWVAVNSGVVEEEHGDHSHWHFEKPPGVVLSQLDQQQGNPAHVYNYEGDIFLANDKNNGFTLLRAAALNSATNSTSPTDVSRFYSGGGGRLIGRSTCDAEKALTITRCNTCCAFHTARVYLAQYVLLYRRILF